MSRGDRLDLADRLTGWCAKHRWIRGVSGRPWGRWLAWLVTR